ncbi:BZ3500_MvSof-1268-A1-R1_Chr9g10717 [Microbotryum saponariae]|uniref:BZ3500_MvSof-1268-A1-R1_Chr9g10717 protein n=1 Tax=Microbotryum saponariae TaxID=289078 RepID=A0A2X0N6Z5_9BASI|nr:BZ3501_MvSof-1269-A2-R1_Chr9g10465 [Microbotryum saponariae]SDA00577.1 BZ3500_MvSof-1268-A1-R1_Chr9g10717 [Microbotryum saponariae]
MASSPAGSSHNSISFTPLSLPRPPTPSLPTTEDATVESGLLPEQQQQQQQRQRAWANIRPRAAEDQDNLPPDLEGQEPEAALMKISDQDVDGYKEQDRFLPIANVARVMKRVLPSSTKVSKESKEIVQEYTSEFISFITSEAAERCSAEKRKTINGEDLLFAMNSLGFENYAEVMKIYLSKWRALSTREDKRGKRKNSTTGDPSNQNGNGDVIRGSKRRNKKVSVGRRGKRSVLAAEPEVGPDLTQSNHISQARTEQDGSESTSRSEDQLDGDQGDDDDEEEEDDDEDQDEDEGDEDGRRVYGL